MVSKDVEELGVKLIKRSRSFNFVFFSFCVFCGYVNKQRKQESSDLKRYVFAGTVATIGVELVTHFLDTLNIRSKVHDPQPKKGKIRHLFWLPAKFRHFLSLFRGYQAVYWGYLPSSLVYFYIYGNIRFKLQD